MRTVPSYLMLASICLCLATSPARAECLHYEDYLHPVSHVRLAGVASGVAVQDGYAYLADGGDNGDGGGLQIVDVSDPLHLVVTAIHGTPGTAMDVAVSGNHAYLADGAGGLHVFDISEPSHPYRLVTIPGEVSCVTVEGNRAYVSENRSDGSDLMILDITDPYAPVVLGTVTTSGYAYRSSVSGNYVYLANGPAGLKVIDVSDPAAPAIVGSVSIDWAYDAAVSGNYAYVAYHYGLKVVDISNPTAPTAVADLPMPGIPESVCIRGDRAFVSAYTGGVQAVDISVPSSPRIAGSVGTLAAAYDLAIDGEMVYVADSGDGLELIGIGNAVSPPYTGRLRLPSRFAAGIKTAGSYAYMAFGERGLGIADISDPASPQLVGYVQRFAFPNSVALNGPYAYLTLGVEDFAGGVDIIDVSDPTRPRSVANVSDIDAPSDVAGAGDYMYVASSTQGLVIVDVSVPSAPHIVGYWPEHSYGVAIAPPYAIVATGSRVNLIDVSNPSAPVRRGYVNLPGYANRIAVMGHMAYVCLGIYGPYDGGLAVVDFTNPASPALLGSVELAGNGHGVSLGADHAYVTTSSGLQIVDVTDPTAPRSRGSVDLGAGDVAVWADHAFVTDPVYGLHVYPTQCLEPGDAPDGAADDAAGSAARGAAGAVADLQVVPNPCRDRSGLRLTLPQGGSVQIFVCDAAGRRVRTLRRGPLNAGSHELAWDGRDDAGRETPAGVYFARASTPAGPVIARLVRIR